MPTNIQGHVKVRLDSAVPAQRPYLLMLDIRFAKSDDVSVAYHVVGDGPIDIVYVQGAWTHLEMSWELPAIRNFCERIGEFARLIRFDKRGMGMSDRVPGATTLETRMDDIRAVMDAVGSERAALIGESEGGPLSMLFAAAHPDRTRALILQGAEVRERTDDDWPWGEATEENFEASMAMLPEKWGKGTAFVRLLPSLGDVEWGREWLGRVQRNAATPNAIEGFMRMAFDIDVRDLAPSINVPTLIYHAQGDQVCHVENARFLARTIPGAKYIERPGVDHLPWAEDADSFISELREFLTGERDTPSVDRVLATVLFTDIVGSTERAFELGDNRWRDVLGAHHDAVGRSLDAFGGTLIDTAGDGIFATFEGPARAIRAAQSIGHDSAPMGLQVRAGVHTGEVERLANNVTGIAVHVGARVASEAAPGEVWVSSIVRDLTAGSGLDYDDRGIRVLKGVPGEWHLYSVA
jgi:pimeloyl-ACP methyl ester carboxylesterase